MTTILQPLLFTGAVAPALAGAVAPSHPARLAACGRGATARLELVLPAGDTGRTVRFCFRPLKRHCRPLAGDGRPIWQVACELVVEYALVGGVPGRVGRRRAGMGGRARRLRSRRGPLGDRPEGRQPGRGLARGAPPEAAVRRAARAIPGADAGVAGTQRGLSGAAACGGCSRSGAATSATRGGPAAAATRRRR